MVVFIAALVSWWALLGLAGLALIRPALRVVRSGGRGPALITVLKTTGVAELACAVTFTIGLVLSTLV